MEILSSLDNGYAVECEVIQPDKYSQLPTESSPEILRISRGGGLSYCAASFGANSLSVSHLLLNRIIDFSEDEMTIEAEAGVTLGQLFYFLSKFNLYISSQPGHSSITLGGCIAANTHGKDSFCKGTFINQVESIKLFHPSYGFIETSRINHPEIFNLTCGGFGLTGHIISAKVKLNRFESYILDTSPERTESFESTLNTFKENLNQSNFVYSWHNIKNNGCFGSGLIFKEKFSINNDRDKVPIILVDKFQHSAPFKIRKYLPFNIFNSLTSTLMNNLFLLKNKYSTQKNLYKSIYAAESFDFYFSLYGKNGFHEYQVIIPSDATTYFVNEVKKYIRSHKILITLCSSKYFSEKNSLLRFSSEGLCISFDFARSSDSNKFCNFLDSLSIETGSLPSIIKDSRITKKTIDHCYPEVDYFREQINAFDPKRLFRSELSRRLDL